MVVKHTAYIPNLRPLAPPLYLEKFVVGGWWWWWVCKPILVVIQIFIITRGQNKFLD